MWQQRTIWIPDLVIPGTSQRVWVTHDIEGEVDWPQVDGWRTLSGWIWVAYFVAEALVAAWLVL